MEFKRDEIITGDSSFYLSALPCPGRWLEQALTLFTTFGFRSIWSINNDHVAVLPKQYPLSSNVFSNHKKTTFRANDNSR